MSKNKQILIFSGIGIAVLGGVAAVLMLTAPKPETAETDIPSQSEEFDSSLILCDRNENELTKVVIKNSAGGYEITPNGSDDSGKLQWMIAGLEKAPLVQTDLKAAAGYAAYFEAKEFAEETDDLKKYGLDNPKAEVTAVFSDGTEFSFKIGNDVPNTSAYAYMTADGKNVYTCYKSRVDSYSWRMFDFVDKTAVHAYDQSTGEEVMKLTVERNDLPEPLVIENIMPDDENAIQVYSYRLTSPYTAYADLQDAPDFMYSLFGLKAMTVCTVGKENIDRNAVGLDNTPNGIITVETNQKTYKITLGAALVEDVTAEDGTVSQKVTGIYGTSSEYPDILYLFDYNSITAMQIKPERLISKLFLMPYIYTLDSIEYKDSEGRSFAFGIETKKKEDGSEEHNFYLDGKKHNDQQIKDMYQYFISAAGEELYFDEDKGDYIATITYNYLDKSKGIGGKDVVEFYSSNTDRKVIISLNGENIFKTRQMYTTQLFDNIERFKNGEKIVLSY